MAKPLLTFTADRVADDTFRILLENGTLGLALGSCLTAMRSGNALTIAYRGRHGTTARLILPEAIMLMRAHELICTGYDSRSGRVRRFAVDHIVDHEQVLLRTGNALTSEKWAILENANEGQIRTR